MKDSEYAACEMIIFPILAEVYYHHRQKFVLWSHNTLTYDDRLTGIPNYTLAKRSPLGKVIWDKVTPNNRSTGGPSAPNSGGVDDSEAPRLGGWGPPVSSLMGIA